MSLQFSGVKNWSHFSLYKQAASLEQSKEYTYRTSHIPENVNPKDLFIDLEMF